MTFEEELTQLINKHSLEHGCANTPDFILAKYVSDCIQSYLRGEPRRINQYLENRLRAAFQAGWDAALGLPSNGEAK